MYNCSMPMTWISNGEFLDKWTILEIKLRMLPSEEQISKVKVEMGLLEHEFETICNTFQIESLITQLRETNQLLWKLMDLSYEMKTPDEEYARLSLEIVYQNQQRSFIKREIDNLTGSQTSEQKSYFFSSEQLVNRKED